ncbi:MAG: NADH-quinone oxidoreductase subunit C [Holosporales bacterium]|jgi:NADH:ubiquinone oxidoreductase subunit C|nr:NADH-quinone oxidoreductase subunit C [Holosporales bacterium]
MKFANTTNVQSTIEIYAKIQKITGIEFDEIDEALPVLHIPSSQLIRVLTVLNNNNDLSYKRLIDIVFIERLYKSKFFEINYIIMSNIYNNHLNVCINIEENGQINSVEHIYKSAYYRECEIMELLGIEILNNKKFRKLITKRTL